MLFICSCSSEFPSGIISLWPKELPFTFLVIHDCQQWIFSVFVYLKISLFCLHLERCFKLTLFLLQYFESLVVVFFFHYLLAWLLLMKSQTLLLSLFSYKECISLAALKFFLSLLSISLFTMSKSGGFLCVFILLGICWASYLYESTCTISTPLLLGC